MAILRHRWFSVVPLAAAIYAAQQWLTVFAALWPYLDGLVCGMTAVALALVVWAWSGVWRAFGRG